jgi:stress-induced morphogen
MPITPETIRARLLEALPDAAVVVRDSTGQGDHFMVAIVSASFEGQGLVERHRRVYAALGQAMQSDIHALALDTLTPAEQASRSAAKISIRTKETP